LTSTVSDPGLLDVLTYTWSVTKNAVAFGSIGSGDDLQLHARRQRHLCRDAFGETTATGFSLDTKTVNVTNVIPGRDHRGSASDQSQKAQRFR